MGLYSDIREFFEHVSMVSKVVGIQLFRERLSKKYAKAYATMPQGSLGNTR